jgi:hypothetical protein
MTLHEAVYQRLINNSDLAEIVGTDIYYETLPQNWDFKKPSVVYQISQENAMLELSGEQFGERSEVRNYCFSPDSIENLAMAGYVADALFGTLEKYNFGITQQEDQTLDFENNVWQVQTNTMVDFVTAKEAENILPPSAFNPAIEGTVREFETVTGTYVYSDPQGLAEVGSLYQWFVTPDPLAPPFWRCAVSGLPGCAKEYRRVVW